LNHAASRRSSGFMGPDSSQFPRWILSLLSLPISPRGVTAPKLPFIKPFQANKSGIDGMCMVAADGSIHKAL
ncbi:MAG: hypothetical protein V4712_10005, partial [Pseudomonadota bacterium]